MAQASQKPNSAFWLQGMPGSLERMPAEQVKLFLLARLREIDHEIEQIRSIAPSTDWWLQRVGETFVELDAPEWDPFLYMEYLKAMRRAIVTAMQMI